MSFQQNTAIQPTNSLTSRWKHLLFPRKRKKKEKHNVMSIIKSLKINLNDRNSEWSYYRWIEFVLHKQIASRNSIKEVSTWHKFLFINRISCSISPANNSSFCSPLLVRTDNYSERWLLSLPLQCSLISSSLFILLDVHAPVSCFDIVRPSFLLPLLLLPSYRLRILSPAFTSAAARVHF